jgi:hypothetical protein
VIARYATAVGAPRHRDDASPTEAPARGARAVALALVLLAACGDDGEPPSAIELATTAPAAAAAAPTDPAAIAARAHDALVRHCGECHEAHRPTAKPEALAIFDLDLSTWADRFTPPRLDAAIRRFAAKPEADRAAMAAFRAARAGS